MDRPGADLDKVCQSIRSKLDTPALPVHYIPPPLAQPFTGVVDLVRLVQYTW